MVLNTQALLDAVEQTKDIPSIVEGKRDVAALEKLGFSHIIQLDAPLFEIVERCEKGSTVQILTDLDKEGKGLYRRLHSELTQRGVKIDNTLRRELLKSKLSHIEGLDTYLENLTSREIF